MVDNLPLSRKHSKGYGYVDYFTKHKRGRGLFEVIKNLAIIGPKSRYDLSKLSQKNKLTNFSWVLVHKYITTLETNGLVKEFGKQQGQKHESTLFGLTFIGIVIACLVDDEIFDNRKQIIKNYSKYDDKHTSQFFVEDKTGEIVVPKIVEINDKYTPLWKKSEMLISILEFTKDVTEVLPKTANVFAPENLNTILATKRNIERRLYFRFFNTLSDEIIEIAQKYNNQRQFNQTVESLIEKNLLQNLIDWMQNLQAKINLHSYLLNKTRNMLEIKQQNK